MNEQQDIDDILARRAPVAARPDLAERIIHAAARAPRQPLGLFSPQGFMHEALSCFLIPRPALSLAACLLIGVTGGWMTATSQTVSYDESEMLNLVVINEEGWL
ncbi:MAG: hypothetical protein HYS17_04005 [Micavibrio aeruginosavorus]|uniref:Uncharacterized protein n=1 Tax=Micavibrio aeruginosavorus TaxID=349221 RepID=A0A7T5R3L7_9BACT|nr:MAG: hypothetical protein HYS17_04005 [Micavibrio aeruginosavorus]